MKTTPFDLFAAKRGAQVVTRDGRPARILCFDYKSCDADQPIVATSARDDSEDDLTIHNVDGMYFTDGKESDFDLLMVVDDEGSYIYPETAQDNTPSWRKIKDGLPPILSTGVSKEVVVRSNDGRKTVAFLKKSRNGTTNWKTNDKSFDLETISAWCPIPDYDRLEFSF